MTIQKRDGQGACAVQQLLSMEPFIKRLHETADHLNELMDGSYYSVEQHRLKSAGFLIRLMKEDALHLCALYTQATKTEP